MAWALVGEDNWGVTARMAVDFREPVDGRRADPRRGVDHHARVGGSSTRPGTSSTPTTGVELATATGVYVAAERRPQARRSASATRYRAGRARRPRDAAAAELGPPDPVDDRTRDRRPGPQRGDRPAPSRSSPPTATPAEALGADLAELTNDPDGFADGADDAGSRSLADPEYLDGQQRVAPGHRRRSTASAGRCWPPSSAASATRPAATGRRRSCSSPTGSSTRPELEARWFAFGLLERTLDVETERTWQLLRRAAREAGDWITVDSLAHPYGKGIAAEPYRWAELEQLVYSPSRWERRLVGSTIATMTHVDRRRGRDPRSPSTPCRCSAS